MKSNAMQVGTIPLQHQAESLDTGEMELSLLPLDQLVHHYIDEIFADFSAGSVTLRDLREEIKAIIEDLTCNHKERLRYKRLGS